MKKTLAILASVILALTMLYSCKEESKALTDGQWNNTQGFSSALYF